ncbi:PAS domain-containing protein [Alloyangia pacifica]|uniref:PAS fold-containing protein n=1 Tax=Alloyangia pacifica TaxID=311180 RepID=A0A1I6VW70_9RHOB|nr:PAS domain-containing protein [Alloyangia pacifica]SDI22982.1 PAS fold-containing protein [Alloyangia pacifica]SFT17947.1 PAS fold-containing protein [Alloyangia pacifica]
MLIAKTDLEATALSTVMGYLAQRTTVCAKVLDRDGKVIAVNKRGLELLNTDADTICGQVWTGFWDGAERVKAEAALATAFGGKPSSFVGSFTSETGNQSEWEVEIVPLDWAEGEVARVLALSSFMSGTAPDKKHTREAFEDRDMLSSLSELFHTLTNLTAVSTSAANILRRGVDQERADALAEALSEAGERAAQAVECLREQIDGSKDGEQTA